MTEYTDQDREDLAPWLEMAALRAENERLAAELAASKATETPVTEAPTTEALTPAVSAHEAVVAEVEAVSLNQTERDFYESLREVEQRIAPARPTPEPAKPLTPEEIQKAVSEAESSATSPEDLYARLSEIPGAVENPDGRVW